MHFSCLRRDVRIPGPRDAHLPRRVRLYVRGGHVVARRHHLRDVHWQGTSAGDTGSYFVRADGSNASSSGYDAFSDSSLPMTTK